MLELGIGADIFRATAWALRVLFVALIVLALWRGRTWKLKIFYVTVTVLAFASPMFPEIARKKKHEQQYEKARAVFDERCKTAGEQIYKSVDEVEEILLLDLRANDRTKSEANPNWPDAGLPNEYSGDAYIANFLAWEHHEDKRNPRGYLNQTPSDLPGYRYVDAKDAKGVMWRYTLTKPGDPGYPRLAKVELKSSPARYAVSFTNLINPSDRQHWVAGTTVLVTDMQTSEVLARATWYSFEPGLGSTAGGRQPWRFARSCPELRGGQEQAPIRFFVDRVLKPKKGE